jgi:two-component system chemotaxis response regulator CheB
VLIVSISDASSELAVRALSLGALDLVRKPTALATDQLYELGAELVAKVRAAAQARAPDRSELMRAPCEPSAAATSKIVVIGTSTGGPQALARLLPAMPKDLPVPIAIALHIPAGYTEALAARIDEQSAIRVVEASQNLALRPGTAMLARGGAHLALQKVGSEVCADLHTVRPDLLHVPSVDILFESAAKVYGAAVIGVVLTGMGEDGLRGARAIRAAGGTVLTESAASAVIYGMPRAVTEAGLANEEHPLALIAARICAHL